MQEILIFMLQSLHEILPRIKMEQRSLKVIIFEKAIFKAFAFTKAYLQATILDAFIKNRSSDGSFFMFNPSIKTRFIKSLPLKDGENNLELKP